MTLKRKRIEILNYIEELDKERCVICSTSTNGYKPITCDCKAARKILILGEWLNKLTNPRKIVVDNESDIEKMKMIESIKAITIEQFTAEIYREAVKLGLYDKNIQEALGVGYTAYQRYKRNNGFPARSEVKKEMVM